jgi:hypothetical protein
MAFGGMKTMGPECCCGTDCANLLEGHASPFAQLDFASQDMTTWETAFSTRSGYAGTTGVALAYDYDIFNKYVLQASSNTGPVRIYRRPENEFTTPTLILTKAGFSINVESLEADGRNERAFYFIRGTSAPFGLTEHTIGVVNYDGTSDTTIVFYTAGSQSVPACLAYDSVADYLFYARTDEAGATGRPASIHRVKSDGTGDTAIHTFASPRNVTGLDVATLDGKLVWCERINLTAASAEIHVIDYDGSNEATLLTLDNAIPMPQMRWRHSDSYVYYTKTHLPNSASERWDLGRVQLDGSGAEVIHTFPGNIWDTNIQDAFRFRFGCGLEWTGPLAYSNGLG